MNPELPVYATPKDLWQLALPPGTLFQDPGLEPGKWTQPQKQGRGAGSLEIDPKSSPKEAFGIQIRCVSDGELNLPGVVNLSQVPRFAISLDDGATFYPPLFPTDANFIAFSLGGFTLRFENGATSPSFAKGDEWTFQTEPSPDVLRALSVAARIMDGYLRNTYQLPLQHWEDDVRLINCELARWILIKRRGLDKHQDMQIYKPEEAMAWLKQVALGDLQPPLTEDGPEFVFPMVVKPRPKYRTDWKI